MSGLVCTSIALKMWKFNLQFYRMKRITGQIFHLVEPYTVLANVSGKDGSLLSDAEFVQRPIQLIQVGFNQDLSPDLNGGVTQ